MSYNFLRESTVHIVYNGSRYRIFTTPDLSFNQTFAEDAYQVKTLHDQTKMFQGSSITKANPANFNFAVHLTKEKHESIVLELLLTTTNDVMNEFDLYVQSNNATFKLEGCIITEGNFEFGRGTITKLNISGQSKKLTRAGNESFTIPGSVASQPSTRTEVNSILDLERNGSDISNLISGTLSVQNSATWTPFENLQNSLSVTNASTAMYPNKHTLNNRVVSGNITQYLTDDNVGTFQEFDTSDNFRLKTLVNGSTHLDANLTGCIFTKRLQVTEVMTQTFDFRLKDSPANLATVITYNTV
tara:strand:- start:5184 stop:6086 length:903 start_codon:yes stop_codon:yes gene_type:complete